MDEKKRYQIFVSSTFADLEVERGKVMETILTYDCFPAGMEMFPAMDEEIFKYIKRIIDDSDYYLLIIGGRYGSEDMDGVSWTEKEYEYAVSKGIPVIAFDHKSFTKLPADKTDLDDNKRKKLIAFKKKVATGRLIAKWTNADDLALAVAKSLKKVLELQPRIGWVRADSVASSNAQNEIEKFKKELSERQDEVKKLKTKVKKLVVDLKKKDEDLKKNDKEYNVLESKYRAAKQEIEVLNEEIKLLEFEHDIYFYPKDREKNESHPQYEEFTVKGVSFKMVYVKSGSFIMGLDGTSSSENPAHEVDLFDYWIGETQVTQELWQAVMGENPSYFLGDINCPVECVSWEDCMEFIRKLNKLTGKQFRLPTEAQWEFAARGGNIGKRHRYLYAGSSEINDVAWFVENSKSTTHPVREMKPNELSLFDMTGNVWEWCNDWFDPYYYKESPTVDPVGPANGSERVIRGGSWDEVIDSCSVSYRGSIKPSTKSEIIGLRLALK